MLQGFGEHLLTVREVADRLRVSTATGVIHALLQGGELPSVRVLNSIRVSERMLQAFLGLRVERKGAQSRGQRVPSEPLPAAPSRGASDQAGRRVPRLPPAMYARVVYLTIDRRGPHAE